VQDYIIPRNINVKEGLIANLNAKQVLFLIIGGATSVGIWKLGSTWDVAVRVSASIFAVGGALFFTIYKVEGQTLDQYTWNMMKYPFRTKNYDGGVEEYVHQQTPKVCIRYALQ